MKDFFSVCQKKIDAFFERVYDHLAAYMEDKEINRYSFREFALEDKLDNVKLDNKFLQFQLTKTRADLYELQKRPQELRNIISRILLMSDEELQKSSRFSVRRAESGRLRHGCVPISIETGRVVVRGVAEGGRLSAAA